ncbi:hypothetical protein ACFLSA_05245 [Bacteroidota bacterium]
MSTLHISKSVLLIGALNLLFILSCSENGDNKEGSVASCEGCHTNYAYLQEVYSPDTAAPVGGCGGEAPHYEPYERVFMGDEGFDSYKKSGHYEIGCTGCHNGTDNTSDKVLAHSGDFIAHPSEYSEQTCASSSCHQDIVDNHVTSLHNGTGQKRKVAIRSGLSGPDDFEQLPAHQIEGYNKNCATCHANCGSCHVVRPKIAGGGLKDGHNFIKTPDMTSVCVTCHTSRGGHAYLGVASGTKPDVHLTKMEFKCTSCHTADELHGDGKKVEQRYAYEKLPKCENCHTGIETKNAYHTLHYADFNCQVCHSQVYNNCGSCHIHGAGARISSYMDFKIALNPIPEVKSDFDFALVRRTLAAPDNWKEYGVDSYSNFNNLPTYNYTTPHNILRWTERTEVASGENCYINCHISNESGTLVNKELYLFEEDLLDWEKSASAHITVDNDLPEGWFQ